MANINTYAFEVIATTADSTSKDIQLKKAAQTTIKARDDQATERFDSFVLDSTVSGQTSSQKITSSTFAQNFPVDGQFYMSDRAQMFFTYQNS